MSVPEMESFVDIQDRLHPVISGGHIVEALSGIAQGRTINYGRRTRGERVYIDAKDLLGGVSYEGDLKARFLFIIIREQQQHMTIEGRGAQFLRKGDFKSRARRFRGFLFCS